MTPRSVVHDYLTQRGGAERVLALVAPALEADILTALYRPASTLPEFKGMDVRTLWLDRFAPLRAHHELGLHAYSPAFSAVDFGYEPVLCMSSGWAHHVRGHARHVYLYTPARALYRPGAFLSRHAGAAALYASLALHRARDQAAVSTAHSLATSSKYVARRIERIYGRRAAVIPPPQSLRTPRVATDNHGYLLCVSRLHLYKNVLALVQAMRHVDAHLVLVGNGPLWEQISEHCPPNVQLLGQVDDEALLSLYDNCEAVVAPSLEDFGLTPLEAAASGKPTIALRAGGYVETLVEGRTGTFIDQITPAEISGALNYVRDHVWHADDFISLAEMHSPAAFLDALRNWLEG